MSKNFRTSDEALIRRLATSDPAAFTEIYNRYGEKLLAIAYYFTQHKQAAEDIVQEVMMSLWMRREEVQIRSLNAYLGTAVKFAVFKSISREKKRKGNLLEYQPPFASEVEAALDAKFLEEYLQGIVEELPEKARLVFTYSRTHHFTISTIAAQMNLSPKAVEYHLTRALKALKNQLQKIKSLFV
jgi:RNA polymerase sigma-70 factor (ECF subfamily)